MSSKKSRRAVQAAETQQLILEAALKLFSSRGYGATSVADIAEEAGVAVPTVYASVGPKTAVLRRLLDWMDERADVPELARRLMASTDPAEILNIQVTIARQLSERCGDVLAALASAAQVDTEMAKLYADGVARHRAGARKTTERLAAQGALRDGLPAERAAAMIATLTLPTVWRELHANFGWSFAEAEAWIIGTLSDQLF